MNNVGRMIEDYKSKIAKLERLQELHTEMEALKTEIGSTNGVAPQVVKRKKSGGKGFPKNRGIRDDIRKMVANGKPFTPTSLINRLAMKRPDVKRPDGNVYEFLRNSREFKAAGKGKFRFVG